MAQDLNLLQIALCIAQKLFGVIVLLLQLGIQIGGDALKLFDAGVAVSLGDQGLVLRTQRSRGGLEHLSRILGPELGELVLN